MTDSTDPCIQFNSLWAQTTDTIRGAFPNQFDDRLPGMREYAIGGDNQEGRRSLHAAAAVLSLYCRTLSVHDPMKLNIARATDYINDFFLSDEIRDMLRVAFDQ